MVLLNCLTTCASIRTSEEANEVTAVRLTGKRRFARVGDLFRLSPYADVFLWGRLIKEGEVFRSRKYSEMMLANLSGAGGAVRELKIA